jgi:hypothetical protein
MRAAHEERALAMWADLAAQSGIAQLHGRCGLVQYSSMRGLAETVRALAEETVAAARTGANPYLYGYALYAYGLAFADTDPARSLDAFRQALAHSRDCRFAYMEAQIARAAARVEAMHGDPDQALTLFDHVISSFHQSGNDLSLAFTLEYVAVFFDRVERPEIAATLYGAANHVRENIGGISSDVLGHLRNVLGDADFERCTAHGAAMDLTDAARYARDQIRLARAATHAPDKIVSPGLSGRGPTDVNPRRMRHHMPRPRNR